MRRHGAPPDTHGTSSRAVRCFMSESAEPLDSLEPTDDEKETIERWLKFCFEADDLRETAEVYFDDGILEANQNLQVELSEYADWIGAEVQTLDGQVEKVERLLVRDGRPCLDFFEGFAFATEAKLVRKADGNVPHRIAADPIMEQVFLILEARGLTREQIDIFLDDEEGNEPARLYESYIGPAINELHKRIEEAAHE